MVLVSVEVEWLAAGGSPCIKMDVESVESLEALMMKQRPTWLPASSEQRPGKVEEQEVPAGQEEQARPTEYIFPPDRLPALEDQSCSWIVSAMIRERPLHSCKQEGVP